jgi:hypothetical protein
MSRFKSVLSFAVGMGVLLAFMFGVNWLTFRLGLLFVVGAYVVMFLLLLVGFLLFAPGLRRK